MEKKVGAQSGKQEKFVVSLLTQLNFQLMK